MESLFTIFSGILLSAACGFRVFVPLLVMSMASKAGQVRLPPDFEWIGTNQTLLLFLVATIIEIIACTVPYVDNLFKILATPAAIMAGIIITAAFVTDISPQMSPQLRWTLGFIVGGLAAGSTQTVSIWGRFMTGLMPIIPPVIEHIAAGIVSALPFLLPLLF
ncbi:MAG TPA: DUF4126 domain-containing protein [Leptolyngbyaceae cyanobacterium]